MRSGPVRFNFSFYKKDVMKYSRHLQTQLGKHAEPFTKDLINLMHKRAMRYLDQQVRSGWGHSENQSERIENTLEFEPMTGVPGRFSKRAKYTSPHAWIVEHGAAGGYVYDRSKVFPIGKQQFGEKGVQAFSHGFRLQPGYHYAEHGAQSITKRDVDRIFNKYAGLMK